MTDTIIALIPDYGLILLFVVIVLASLALPLPASVLVLTAGAFAAAGDLSLWQVLVVSHVAFVIGDIIAFWVGSLAGRPLLNWARQKSRLQPVLQKSEDLLEAKGEMAILLSHTILSPTCPYICYLSGAGGMVWSRFARMAVIGAAIWTGSYVALGYVFADQLTQVAEISSNFFGIVLAGLVAFYCVIWLRKKWAGHLEDMAEME